MKVVIIGGGIIGLSSALYLRRTGWDVVVADKHDLEDNCSYGNAGYICPSHFIPLATPGIVIKALKWMWNSKSPFYVQPRLDWQFFRWGWHFLQSANARKVNEAMIPLRDIALLSQREFENWLHDFDFAYEKKGILEYFHTEKGKEHALQIVEKAHAIGLTETKLLQVDELRQKEPHVQIHAQGAVYFPFDAHCYPNKLMAQLKTFLKQQGVQLLPHTEVTGFCTENGKIKKAETNRGNLDADEFILAGGAHTGLLAQKLKLSIPLVPGRGYSLTIENGEFRLNYPAILYEKRVAITPMNGNKMRFGGTMEITSLNTPPRMKRMQGILESVTAYFPDFKRKLSENDQVWYGFRPLSADGLPYLGRVKKYKNLTVASGHSMLGLSLGAGTGLLVSEILNGKTLSMDIRPFDPDRFS